MPSGTPCRHSFGNPSSSNSASPANPFTYTGREFDAKSGLYYYRSRYYAPDQGRMLSEDPIDSINSYTYTQNDSVDFSDPSGALAVEYSVLTANPQRVNLASCISTFVGAVAGVAVAGVSAAFDQPGAVASQARDALIAGAITTTVSCALASVPAAKVHSFPGPGAMGRLVFEGIRKHPDVAAEAGQAALDSSVQVSANSTRRVGIDYASSRFIVFDESYPESGIFHGHYAPWTGMDALPDKAKAALIKAGLVTNRGKIE